MKGKKKRESIPYEKQSQNEEKNGETNKNKTNKNQV